MYPHAQDIRYFLEVAETLNVSRAAERLGIRQPSLSEALRRLEHAVGQTLLLRSKQGVALTKAGEVFRHEGRELLLRWERLRSEIRSVEEELAGHFSLGCHASVGLYTLHHALPKLLRSHPRLTIRVVHDLSRKVTEQVISRQLDLGIVVNPVNHPDLVIRELYEDEVSVWTSAGALEGVLLCDPELVQSQAILAKLRKSEFRLDRLVPVPSLEVICSLIEAGAGSGIVPARVVREYGSTKLKPMAGKGLPTYQDRVCLIYRKDTQTSRAAKQLISEVGASLAGV